MSHQRLICPVPIVFNCTARFMDSNETQIETDSGTEGCDHEAIIQDDGFWIYEPSPWHKLL